MILKAYTDVFQSEKEKGRGDKQSIAGQPQYDSSSDVTMTDFPPPFSGGDTLKADIDTNITTQGPQPNEFSQRKDRRVL